MTTRFDKDGFDKIHIEIPDWVQKDIDRTVRTGNRNVAVATKHGTKRFIDRDQLQPGTRLLDLHNASTGARWLYLHEEIHEKASELLEGHVTAFQSLYFHWGSQQAIHRDPTFVVSDPPMNLLGVWIALEDVCGDAGPLQYVPKSHTGRHFEFPDGKLDRHGRKWNAGVLESRRVHDAIEAEKFGGASEFICKAGDVFFWHAGLLHGGAPIKASGRTRKSLVVHFCKAGGVQKRDVWCDGRYYRTTEIAEVCGRRGLWGPLK